MPTRDATNAKIFDHLCAEHDIEYFLTGGSLLGAIRHRGFIPWDDDLDVGMTRRNYEKFIEKAVPQLPKDIFFQNRETDPHYPYSAMVEARLRDKFSSYGSENQLFHDGLQVDIFVYDRAFLPIRFLIIVQNIVLGWLKGDRKRADVLKWIDKNSKFPLVYASSYLQNFGMLKRLGTYKTERELSNLVKTKFEDMDAYVPSGWDSFLKRQYGDYLKLPSAEDQMGHHSGDLANPFVPCSHKEVLVWNTSNHRIMN